ncbi:MAG: phasin family protein [Myxococcales bacterium]|nr:phasin family protein [Myxococcales bacterium]
MAEAGLIQDGIDRVETAFGNIEKEYKRLQKRAEKRRKDFEKRAEKEFKRVATEIRKNPVVKRAESIRTETRKSVEGQVEQLLGGLRIATRADVQKLDRKITQLNKKLRDLSSDAA